MIYKKSWLVLGAVALFATPASGQQFSGGMPAGWACVGTCGTLGANGVVTLAGGGSQYGYVSTANGVNGVALSGVGGSGVGTDGSTLTSTGFSANASDILKFNFNYVTSDGAGFSDYAWARLLDASFNQVALLFTARTTLAGNTVPGAGMPAPTATLTPGSTPIIGTCEPNPTAGFDACANTRWAPLGPSNVGGGSGDCWDTGCGYTGWVEAKYSIAAAGTYYLEFGVTNWDATGLGTDTFYDSGLAFDGLQINNTPISVVPEPASVVLMASGLIAVMGVGYRRRKGSSAAA
jgi:hypothetical protein